MSSSSFMAYSKNGGCVNTIQKFEGLGMMAMAIGVRTKRYDNCLELDGGT